LLKIRDKPQKIEQNTPGFLCFELFFHYSEPFQWHNFGSANVCEIFWVYDFTTVEGDSAVLFLRIREWAV